MSQTDWRVWCCADIANPCCFGTAATSDSGRPEQSGREHNNGINTKQNTHYMLRTSGDDNYLGDAMRLKCAHCGQHLNTRTWNTWTPPRPAPALSDWSSSRHSRWWWAARCSARIRRPAAGRPACARTDRNWCNCPRCHSDGSIALHCLGWNVGGV